jgi:hypothetical protein
MNTTTKRFPRTLAEAFPSQYPGSIYFDMSIRAIFWRWVRRALNV